MVTRTRFGAEHRSLRCPKAHPLDIDKPSDIVANEVRNGVLIMQKLCHLHIAIVLFHFKDEIAYSIIMLLVADYDLRKFLSLSTRKTILLPWRNKYTLASDSCLMRSRTFIN